MDTIEKKMIALSKKHRFNYELQTLQFGFRRARIECNTHAEMSFYMDIFHHCRSLHIDINIYCKSILIMLQSDYTEYTKKSKDEQNRLHNWWARYHYADAETKRLMANGTIA